jgi:hypothetical protein
MTYVNRTIAKHINATKRVTEDTANAKLAASLRDFSVSS